MEARSMSRVPRWLTVALVGALAAAFVVIGGLPAHANPLSVTPDGSATAVASQSDSKTLAQSTISCYLYVHNPHKSTHVTGTINVQATWTCSATVAELEIDIYLYRNGILVGDASASKEATSQLRANAYVGCRSGTYVGIADGRVLFPAGYTPPSLFRTVQSNSVHISC